MVFTNLKPHIVWKYFEEICKIPRLSKNEHQIRSYLLDFAKKNQLKSKTDAIGNVLISKEADKGYESRKSVILQSHMDMVGEKNADVVHDWKNDPITAVIDGEWIKAKDTTLGADDGIGIAAQLALLSSKEIKTGAIECLFTVDEETGMSGVIALKPGFFKSSILINLDSEDEGELFIGCAGGIDTVAHLNYKKEDVPEKQIAIRISLTGLHGGHSGDEIHNNYGNSVKLMTRLLLSLEQNHSIRLAGFDGGNLRNAIPREAFAIIVFDESAQDNITAAINDYYKSIKSELSDTDPDINIDSAIIDLPKYIIDIKNQASLLATLDECPHGVIAWSKEMEGLVETSTNLASVKFKDNSTISIITSQRSSVDTEKYKIAKKIETVFRKSGAHVLHSAGYPGWKPDINSEILAITKASYTDLFKNQPVVRAIHAGLECGLILEKFPGLDMISFGPTIKGAHTPEERINIETTEKFWILLLDVLQRIPDRQDA